MTVAPGTLGQTSRCGTTLGLPLITGRWFDSSFGRQDKTQKGPHFCRSFALYPRNSRNFVLSAAGNMAHYQQSDSVLLLFVLTPAWLRLRSPHLSFAWLPCALAAMVNVDAVASGCRESA